MFSVKRSFTEAQILTLLSALGSDPPKHTARGELVFQTICHNPAHSGSHKLFYYPDSGLFHCYTQCGESFSPYELVQKVKHVSFYEAKDIVYRILGIQDEKKTGFAIHRDSQDWDILNKYSPQTIYEPSVSQNPALPPSVLQLWPICYPQEWRTDGITQEATQAFGIRFDVVNNAIIIPHKDKHGNLIGIRSRSLDPQVVAQGFKYMPTQLQGKDFRHNLRYNLYGYWENADSIRRIRKVMLVEAEKSVLQCESFYGDNNYTLAVCGSNVSSYQRDMILELGVQEVFLAFDKEYHAPYTEESDAYADKILKIASMFAPYVRTCVLWDTNNLIGYKDSPTDKGRQVLQQLLATKYEIKLGG